MTDTLLQFSQGTLVVSGEVPDLIKSHLKWDPRAEIWRGRACDYADIVLKLHRSSLPYTDQAREFEPVALDFPAGWTPRDYQQNALDAWWKNLGRGVVVLPTGAGKSFLAQMAMVKVKRPTLVVVPTIDLMLQWGGQLEKSFKRPVGYLGGGQKSIEEITVATYDSAVLQMEFIGNKFGLIVFDEAHHLPGNVARSAALMSLAPFRLGLTATPERTDGGEAVLYSLVGTLVFRIEIDQLEGHVLAPYKTERFHLYLDEDEQQAYDHCRKVYTDFVKACRIDFSVDGWGVFIAMCCRKPGGKEAFRCYLEQKRIARTSRAKFAKIWEIIQTHAGERMIIFTADNDTAYEIGRRFFLPVITHHTKSAERRRMLDGFRSADYLILVTSRVLNEGIDVPEASVGIVVSGTGSTREHVQRLGRILRPSAGKEAALYELVSENTSEVRTSDRRRQHRAYQRRGGW